MVIQGITTIAPTHFADRVLEPIEGSPWGFYELPRHAANVLGIVEGVTIGALRLVAPEVKFRDQSLQGDATEIFLRDQGWLDLREAPVEVYHVAAGAVV